MLGKRGVDGFAAPLDGFFIDGHRGLLLPNFVDSVREAIHRVVVSHRVSRKVSGALHEETLYASVGPKGEESRRVRKPLVALTKPEVVAIADAKVREMVREKLSAVGGDPKKVFAKEENLPRFVTDDGRRIVIRKVRIEKKVPTQPLGSGRSTRHVTSESNHHVEIYAEIKPDGSEGRWDGEVVPMLEAYRRKKAGKPIVEREHGPQAGFKFSLAPKEMIECDGGKGERKHLVVRSVSQFTTGRIEIDLVKPTDARLKKEILAAGKFIRSGPDQLRKWHARKVAVSPLGDVHESHD